MNGGREGGWRDGWMMGGMNRRCKDGGGSDGWWVDGGIDGWWNGWMVDGMAPVQLGFPRTSATKEQMSKT